MSFRSGFVTILGKPNAGKSTLLNALLGFRLVITTPKAQTTRHRIFGILNGADHQVIFSDTPGIIKPKYGLHRAMMSSVHQSLEDADLIIILIDLTDEGPMDELADVVRKHPENRLLVLNKADLVSEARSEEMKKAMTGLFHPRETITLSALKGIRVPELKSTIIAMLPEGPKWFDEEQLSDRPERFFISEIIREKIFNHLEEEIPYGCEVTILSFEEGEQLDRISAEIHVEKQTHKGMVIGKGGTMIKKIGTEARQTIEEFLGKKVFLELYVRVAEGWKDDPGKLRKFGYRPNEENK